MKKIVITVLIVTLALSLVMASSGCARKMAEQAVEKAIENAAANEDADVDLDFSEGEINITDEEGNEMSMGGSDIPEDWPSVVPIDNGLEINFSASQTTDGKKGWSVSGIYNGSAEELYNNYKNEFSSWEEVSDSTMDAGEDGKNYTYQATNGTYMATIFVNEADGEVNAVLSVIEE